jgi:uncharacterized protein (DUF488 family)
MKVFTLGTAGRQHYDFTKILNKYGIQVVIDVRRSPASPQHPQFNRDSLQMLCASQGADYIFLGADLGANLDHEVKPGRTDYRGPPDPALRDWLASDEYRRCVSIIATKAEKRATCVLCSELLPGECQRQYLARSLAEKGFEISHIVDETRLWTPPSDDRRAGRPRYRKPRHYANQGK